VSALDAMVKAKAERDLVRETIVRRLIRTGLGSFGMVQLHSDDLAELHALMAADARATESFRSAVEQYQTTQGEEG
jgi:hypothetical protein